MSIWHWVILLLIVVLLFGSGKISAIMTDVAKGIKSFKKGMAEDDEPAAAKGIDHKPGVGDKAEAERSKAG